MRINHTISLGIGIFMLLVSNASAGQPSDAEQYWLQLINRFRADPAGELDHMVNYTQPGTGVVWDDPMSDFRRVASALEFFAVDPVVLRRQFQNLKPAPPLAWSENLHESARYYSSLMIARDDQSHELDSYPRLFERLSEEGGYEITGGGLAAENIYAFASDVQHGHAGFLIDWGNTPTGIQDPPGHRDNLIDARMREIGISVLRDDDPSTDVGPLVATQHLAADFADGPFATGVIHRDLNGDDFYAPGEGLSGVNVELQGLDGRVLAASESYRSGGYRLDISDLRPGSYQIVISDPDPVYWSGPIEISATDQNIAIDVTDPQHSIDSLSRVLREGRTWSLFDLNDDGRFTRDDRNHLIREVFRTYLGDSNLDGLFDSSDLVDVFQANEYEDDLEGNSVWATGDWTGDADFGSGDLVAAFQEGGYEQGPRRVLVPEPSGLGAFALAVLAIAVRSRKAASRRA